MAQANSFGRYESVYDLEEACFRHYRENMKTILQTTRNITDAMWSQNHAQYRKDAIRGFDENCGYFKKQDLVRNARESLIKRIETENLDLIKLYELRMINQAMQESVRESKAMTDKSRETVTQLNAVREEQNQTLEQNNARLASLSSQQSNAREQYSNMSRELAGVEEYMAKLERQRQDQNREQHDLEEQARKNAMRLEELKKLSEEKKKSRFKFPTRETLPWPFNASKKDDKRSQKNESLSGEITENPHVRQEYPPASTNNPPNWDTKSDHQLPEDNAIGLPVSEGNNEPQKGRMDLKAAPVTAAQIPPNIDAQPYNSNIGGNVTPKSLQNISNDNFPSTNSINPAASDECGRYSKSKNDLSSPHYPNSIVVGSPKYCDHNEGDVANTSSETSTLHNETTSMNSKYNIPSEECNKMEKQHTKPNVSQAITDTISGNHDTGFDTQEQMESSSGKNSHSTSKIETCRVTFDKLQNPEHVTQKLTDNIDEIPKIVSKDVDLIDLGNKEDNNSDATIDGIETCDSKTKSLISTETLQDLSSINFEPNAEASFSKEDENVEDSKYNMLPVDDTLVTPETKLSESTYVIQISTSEIDTTSKSTNPFGEFYQPIKNPAANFPPKHAERVTGSGQTPNEYSVQSTEGVESFNQDDEHNQQPLENLSHENSPEEQQTNGFKIVNLIYEST